MRDDVFNKIDIELTLFFFWVAAFQIECLIAADIEILGVKINVVLIDQALDKLQQLLKMQQEPLAILGAVGGHFRRLSAARTLLDNGRNASDLQKLCGIPDYPARKTMEAARRLTPAFCKKAALLILETDYSIKTSFDDSERLLELLILQLAQEARNG